jgi:hypothetical protein
VIINFIVSLIYNLSISNNGPLAVVTNTAVAFLYRLAEGAFYYLAALYIEDWCKKNEK